MQNCYRRIKYSRPTRNQCNRASRQAFQAASTPPTRPQMWGLFQCATRVYKCSKRHWDRSAQHTLPAYMWKSMTWARSRSSICTRSRCIRCRQSVLVLHSMSTSIVVLRASNWRGDAPITITIQLTLSKTLCLSSMRTRRPCCKDTHEDLAIYSGGRSLFNRPVLKLLVPHNSNFGLTTSICVLQTYTHEKVFHSVQYTK